MEGAVEGDVGQGLLGRRAWPAGLAASRELQAVGDGHERRTLVLVRYEVLVAKRISLVTRRLHSFLPDN